MSTSFLRTALGLQHRGHLALEELVGQAAADAAEDTVVMKGPLADVYSDALAAAFDKEKPPVVETPATAGDPTVPAEPSAETGTNVNPADVTPTPGAALEPTEAEIQVPQVSQIIVESQAIDAAVVQALAEATTDVVPEDGNYATLYAIDESQVKPENIVEVTEMLAEAEEPENIAVLIDNVLPADAEADPETVAAQEKVALGLESIVIGMGGKVYRKFGDYVASRRK